MAGIKETKEMLIFIAKLSSSIAHAASDGKLDFMDIARMAPVLMKAGDAMAGMEMIPAELADLTAEERDELIAAFAADFELDQESTEELIEKSLAALGKIHDIYLMFK